MEDIALLEVHHLAYQVPNAMFKAFITVNAFLIAQLTSPVNALQIMVIARILIHAVMVHFNVLHPNSAFLLQHLCAQNHLGSWVWQTIKLRKPFLLRQVVAMQTKSEQ
jgi:hypothetical protein